MRVKYELNVSLTLGRKVRPLVKTVEQTEWRTLRGRGRLGGL